MLTLVLGGARSGKSGYAQSLCDGASDVVFLATARAEDEEMKSRIVRHRAERPQEWTTIEVPLAVVGAVRESSPKSTLLLDCVTNWLANLAWEHRTLSEGERRERILAEVRELARAASERQVVAVSNEVGAGIVPESPAGRSFRDLQGMANQFLAREAAHVVLMVAGLPLNLKGPVTANPSTSGRSM